MTLANCSLNPSGVTNIYLNSFRPKREWKAATFLGQAVTGRFEYSANAATPQRAWYYTYDTVAKTVTTVGMETFDASFNVTGRTQFIGLVSSTALAMGQSESVDFTVKSLVPAQPDRPERQTLTYEANEVVTLPGGRVDTCRVKSTVYDLAGGTASELSVETLHLVPGFGFVKSYYKPTASTYADRNQTYLTELVSTTGSLTLAAPTADTAPPLAQCSALPVGQTLVLTASAAGEENSAVRTISNSTFNGTPAISIVRRNVTTNVKRSEHFFDPAVGFLRYVGVDSYDVTGSTLVQRRARSGRPDLRTTGPSTPAVGYTETYTVLIPANGGTSTSTDTFTFDGYAKITTPAGTFDTCKVTFHYGADGIDETYYHAPNLHWVRLDSTANGVRTTRELISH
ncbi:MAG TPA: hypothetical protein VGP22_14630 [Albitalea sp.]|nr:hypothetical protein [Albitalea sp.]